MKGRDQTNLGPHTGIIKFHVYVHKILPDGSIDPVIVDCSDLFRDFEMTNIGQIYVNGYDKWNCVQKVKALLEGLGDK
jgi:hypothetical protein